MAESSPTKLGGNSKSWVLNSCHAVEEKPAHTGCRAAKPWCLVLDMVNAFPPRDQLGVQVGEFAVAAVSMLL